MKKKTVEDFLESTLKMDLESIDLSSVQFGGRCNIG